MLLSVSGRLVKVLDEIQYQSEIPDSTSWESNPDSMTAVYLPELYICFSLILHLLTRKQGWVFDYLADQKVLASTCWHDSYTQFLQLSATEYCLMIFPPMQVMVKYYIQSKLLRILEVQKSFDS